MLNSPGCVEHFLSRRIPGEYPGESQENIQESYRNNFIFLCVAPLDRRKEREYNGSGTVP
tara:strand:+ start:406 stop:585 length:180 start_codon:yes stop_codon:yes gene_type:complete